MKAQEKKRKKNREARDTQNEREKYVEKGRKEETKN